MTRLASWRGVWLCVVGALSLSACANLSTVAATSTVAHLPATVAAATAAATTAAVASVTAAPRSPLAGEWNVDTDFGKLAFTVDAGGSKVNSLSLAFAHWTCGPTTLTASMQTSPGGPTVWAIDAHNAFSVQVDLNPPHIEEMTVMGAYDAAAKKFAGTWDQDAYGTHCTGTWATPAR